MSLLATLLDVKRQCGYATIKMLLGFSVTIKVTSILTLGKSGGPVSSALAEAAQMLLISLGVVAITAMFILLWVGRTAPLRRFVDTL